MINKGNIGITVLFLFFKLLVSQPCGAHFVQDEKICGETFFCVHIFEVLTHTVDSHTVHLGNLIVVECRWF